MFRFPATAKFQIFKKQSQAFPSHVLSALQSKPLSVRAINIFNILNQYYQDQKQWSVWSLFDSPNLCKQCNYCCDIWAQLAGNKQGIEPIPVPFLHTFAAQVVTQTQTKPLRQPVEFVATTPHNRYFRRWKCGNYCFILFSMIILPSPREV